MKNLKLITFLFLTSNLAVSQEFDSHWGLTLIGARGVSSKVSPTNYGGVEDSYKLIKPTTLTGFFIGENDDWGAYANFRGLFFPYYMASLSPNKHDFVKFPAQRNTTNSNRIATDYNIFTHDLFGYFWGNKLKWGLGYSFQWNAEGFYLNDSYNGNTQDSYPNSEIKYGGNGLGSGVYRTRYRFYGGIGLGLKTSFDDGRVQLALNTTVGPYTGGGMTVAELVASYAFTEKIGINLTCARRRKNFKEFENLQNVIVKTNELNVGIWYRFKRM
jgi:hypothetical protein